MSLPVRGEVAAYCTRKYYTVWELMNAGRSSYHKFVCVTWPLLLMNFIPSFSPPPTKQTRVHARVHSTQHTHYPNLLNFIRLFLETLFPQR